MQKSSEFVSALYAKIAIFCAVFYLVAFTVLFMTETAFIQRQITETKIFNESFLTKISEALSSNQT